MPETQSPRVLLIEDDHTYRELLTRRLTQKGYSPKAFATGEEALRSLKDLEFDVAVVDLSLPGINGIEVLKKLRDGRYPIESIMLTGHGGVKDAVEAMKLGAYHYLEKPIKIAELALYIDKAYKKRQAEQQYTEPTPSPSSEEKAPALVGVSSVMQNLKRRLEQYAPNPNAVLIEGETGSGKDVCARLVHHLSDRHDGPFVAINCGALAESLLENELFGHMKGAFTGADSDQEGVFEIASSGTLFIDEVCEMSLEIQKKFLRVLENGEFRRLGEATARSTKARIIAATNRNVQEEVKAKRFRQDLFYRLNVLTIETSPLRDHPEDIPELVHFFLKKNSDRYPKNAGISEEVMAAFMKHDWPGNVRELQAVIERGIVLSTDGIVRPGDCPSLNFDGIEVLKANAVPGSSKEVDTAESGEALTLDELEKRHLISVMQNSSGNKTQAAKKLGISLRSLYRKLEKHKIE